jgi:hypothetical protein
MFDEGFDVWCSRENVLCQVHTGWKFKMFKKKLEYWFHRTLIGNVTEGYRIKKTYQRWLSKGNPVPVPHAIKPLMIKNFAQKYDIRVFVETGTYLGEMAAAVCNDFDRIYSIELSEDLFKHAAKKFAGHHHITILHGDSFQVLPEILRQIDIPCLFWLDGHYSSRNAEKEKSSIFEELKQISAHPIKKHVILIDDARLFTGKNDYPTIEFLKAFVKNILPYYEFDAHNDIIRIYKKNVSVDFHKKYSNG